MHMPSTLRVLLLLAGSSVLLASSRPGNAQAPTRSRAAVAVSPGERRTEAQYKAARKSGPLALHAFLERMPKGADLHMHLSGAIYAETFLKDAATDQMCIDPIKLALAKNVGMTDQGSPLCPDGTVTAASVVAAGSPSAQKLYDDLVDSFSMRAFVPASGTDGHDQFFATFARFSGLGAVHAGEWLDEIATRAAAQNEQYLEVMQTPDFSNARALAKSTGWPAPLAPATTAATSIPDATVGTSKAELAMMRDKLFAAGLKTEVKTDISEFANALDIRNKLEHCGTPAALPACTVEIKFIYQVLRAFPPQQVFAQTLLGFEVAAADPNVVGINFVQPEDAYMAMTEYHRQMLMLDYLHGVYPGVHISLHAGELAPGMVPPAGLRFHIREAVELGHAERIGHGVDAMYETDSAALLKEMAAKHIMVEINLTSNDVILGITAPNHPLPDYRAAGVPVSLNTDDEGVSRIDLTHEYVTAALTYGLSYRGLKDMARTGIEHTFLPGKGLWATPGVFTRMNCTTAANCEAFAQTSPHAAQQWQLEQRFNTFEAR